MAPQPKRTISKHNKGLLLSEQGDVDSKISGVELRRLLGAPVITLPGQGFVISEECAGAVLELFDTKSTDWDPEILAKAEKQKLERELQIHARLEVALAIQNASHIVTGYSCSQQLDPHQKEAVAAISVPSLRGIAIFDEQGTGKTAMTLAGFDLLIQHGQLSKLLVVAPKSVMGSWKSDAEMLFGNRYETVVVSGSPKQRRRQILGQHDILIVSYNIAVEDLQLLRALLSSKPGAYMLAIDESFYVKNPSAKRTQAIVQLRTYCERAVILCGTPAPNSPHDIVQQIDLADQGTTFGNRPIPRDRTEAIDVIASYLDDAIYLRRLKQDVLPNLPSKQIDQLLFQLQPHQQALYDQARNNLVVAVRNVDDMEFQRHLTSFLAMRAALMQICSHPGAIDPLYDEIPAKHLALDGILEKLLTHQKKKVVIWSYFRHSLQALAERYGNYGLVRIDGSVTSTNARISAIQQFQTDPDTRIFLGNAAAAGAGITLTAASDAIYESFSNQAAHYMQSVDRIHRRGQQQGVTIHVLLAQNTIEESEFARILEKERTGRDLLGDVYDEPLTRERFLASLTA